MDIEIFPQEDGLRLLGQNRVIDINTEALQLWITVPDSASLKLGCLRSALENIMVSTANHLGHDRRNAHQEHLIKQAVYASLRRSAARADTKLGLLESRISKIHETPLLYSFPVLSNHYLLMDARRFLPCRVAIAHVEDTHANELPFPEVAERCGESLRRWRGLFRAPTAAKRAVNKTLSSFGEYASPQALWGLRNVPLSQPVASIEHLEVLGFLGNAQRRCPCLPELVRCMERVSLAELRQGIEQIAIAPLAATSPLDSLPHLFAEVIAPLDVDDNTGFGDIIVQALAHHSTTSSSGDVALPPIPLPQWEGYRFLDTKAAIEREGRWMDHCVGLYAEHAAKGQYYIFHVASPPYQATVALDRHGLVVDAKGPHNELNPLVYKAQTKLAKWGKGFAKTDHAKASLKKLRARAAGDDFCFANMSPQTVIWMSGQTIPPGVVPIKTARELFAEYQKGATRLGDRDGRAMEWFSRWASKAAKGKVWLVKRPEAAWPAISVLNRFGRVVGHTSEILKAWRDGDRVPIEDFGFGEGTG